MTTTRELNTRDRLISAAESLFAEHGPMSVSAREIVRAAGAGNASALQYHFGDRDGLLSALLARHEAEVDSARSTLLDALEMQGEPNLRDLVVALVVPLAAKLGDESGRRYLRIAGELINRPGYRLDPDTDTPSDSLLRWRTLTAPLIDEDARRLHRRFVAVRFVHAELGRRADNPVSKDHQLFLGQLVDLATALLGCPLSPDTRQHLRS